MSASIRALMIGSVVGLFALATVGCASGTSPKSSTASSATFVSVPFTTSGVASSSTSARPGSTTSAAFAPVSSTSTSATIKSTTAGATTSVGARVVNQPGDNVHVGDTGSGVKQIQTALAGHGYKVGADGTFGLQTAQAVKDFQTKNGLTADGIVGPLTWAKLSATSATTTAASTTAKTTTTTAAH
jgi:peptidoglycan hydrolase-like protein with peptidoglycan-binding domain